MHPILFHFGQVALPTFGVCVAVGLMLGLTLSLRTARLVGMDAERVWDAGLFAILAAFVSSRVLLLAMYFDSFRRFPMLLLAVPSLTAPGLALTLIATALWMHFHRLPTMRVLDAWAPCAAVVWGFLALGHFAAGSDPGMPTGSRLGLAFAGETTRLQPVALYVAAFAFALALVLWQMLARSPMLARLQMLARSPMLAHSPMTRSVASVGLIAAGAAQFLLSFLRQPSRASVAGLDGLQVIALGMIVAGAALMVARGFLTKATP